MTDMFLPSECPKREQWFVDGGRCGLAHCCGQCTGHPDFKIIIITPEQLTMAKAKADEMYLLMNDNDG